MGIRTVTSPAPTASAAYRICSARSFVPGQEASRLEARRWCLSNDAQVLVSKSTKRSLSGAVSNLSIVRSEITPLRDRVWMTAPWPRTADNMIQVLSSTSSNPLLPHLVDLGPAVDAVAE